MVSRTIENAQRKVESHNFDIRRQLLEYDDIANEQRRLIYEQREHILMSDNINAIAQELRKEYLREVAETHLPPDTPEEEWRTTELERQLAGDFRLSIPIGEWVGMRRKNRAITLWTKSLIRRRPPTPKKSPIWKTAFQRFFALFNLEHIGR